MLKLTELFEKLCDSWGVEITEIQGEGGYIKPHRTLSYKGKVLDVRYSPDVISDLKTFKGIDAEEEVVRAAVDQLISALVHLENNSTS